MIKFNILLHFTHSSRIYHYHIYINKGHNSHQRYQLPGVVVYHGVGAELLGGSVLIGDLYMCIHVKKCI